MKCKHDGRIYHSRGLHGVEVLIMLFLFLFGIIPGIIYYIIIESRPICNKCGKRL